MQRRQSRLPDNLAKYKDVTFLYTVRVLRNNKAVEVPVSHKAFSAIFGIGKGKLEYIQKSLKLSGMAPKDKRGLTSRDHKCLDVESQKAIEDHIRSFKKLATPSRYGRKDSSKYYLPEELNIKKMYCMFKSHEIHKNVNVSYDSYRRC